MAKELTGKALILLNDIDRGRRVFGTTDKPHGWAQVERLGFAVRAGDGTPHPRTGEPMTGAYAAGFAVLTPAGQRYLEASRANPPDVLAPEAEPPTVNELAAILCDAYFAHPGWHKLTTDFSRRRTVASAAMAKLSKGSTDAR